MELNPYASPREPQLGPTTNSRGIADILFFAINFSIAIFLIVSFVSSILISDNLPTNPIALVSGLVASIPVSVYALAELIGFIHKNRSIEVGLGVANFLCACLVGFAMVANVVEALSSERLHSAGSFLIVFVPISSLVCVYLFLSSRNRLYRGSAKVPCERT